MAVVRVLRKGGDGGMHHLRGGVSDIRRAHHVVVLRRCRGRPNRNRDHLFIERRDALSGGQHLRQPALSGAWLQGAGDIPRELQAGHILPAGGAAVTAVARLPRRGGGAAGRGSVYLPRGDTIPRGVLQEVYIGGEVRDAR